MLFKKTILNVMNHEIGYRHTHVDICTHIKHKVLFMLAKAYRSRRLKLVSSYRMSHET